MTQLFVDQETGSSTEPDAVRFEQAALTLSIKARSDIGQAELDASATALSGLFKTREEEFSFNPAIVAEYPETSDATTSPLLVDPVGYIDGRIVQLEREGGPITGVVLLTTFGDKLHSPLSAAGYRGTPIDMPAGPDFTCWFELERARLIAGRTLYLEAVNEADDKIRPSFALELRDAQDRLRGGACGSVHERNSRRFAYLATMTLDTGLPRETGRRLGEALIDFLRTAGVDTVHLGTQTAGPFYEKLGFRIVHRVLPDLRLRRTADGSVASTDLVMMEMEL